MNRLDFIICWFSLYLIVEEIIQIFIYEIKLGEVELNYEIAQILTLLHI